VIVRAGIVALLLIAACKQAPATCAQLAPVIRGWGTTEVANDKLTGDAARERQQLFELTAELYPKVCEQGRWSGDAIDCLIDAKTEDDAQKCALTKDQREDLTKALVQALSGDRPKARP
jgi:hypothetical protein